MINWIIIELEIRKPNEIAFETFAESLRPLWLK
jgi:hypothetical protein